MEKWQKLRERERDYPRKEDIEGKNSDANKSSSNGRENLILKPSPQSFLSLLQWHSREIADERPFLAETKRSTEQQRP